MQTRGFELNPKCLSYADFTQIFKIQAFHVDFFRFNSNFTDLMPFHKTQVFFLDPKPCNMSPCCIHFREELEYKSEIQKVYLKCALVFVKIYFYKRHYSLISFGGPQLYNSEAMPFTYSVCCYD